MFKDKQFPERGMSMVSNSIANFERWDALSDIVSPVGPDFRIPGQYASDRDTNIDLGRQQDTHPALFDQNQQNGGFGPVYAIPTFPPANWYIQNAGGRRGLQQDTHPALFDQNQQNGSYGPVYAIPTYPPHFTQGQVSGANPWQYNYGQENGWGQWGGQFQTTTPFWSFNPWCIHPFFRYL